MNGVLTCWMGSNESLHILLIAVLQRGGAQVSPLSRAKVALFQTWSEQGEVEWGCGGFLGYPGQSCKRRTSLGVVVNTTLSVA